jgi:hypothetical protein
VTRQRGVFPGDRRAKYSIVPVGRGRYDLNPGDRASVLVHVNRKGAKLLAKGPFTAWALARADGTTLETARLLTLRRAGKPIP